MHEYYQKNRSKLQKVMNRFLTLIAPELEQASGKPRSTVLQECWSIYKPPFVRRWMGKLFTNPKLLNKIFLKKDAKNAANAAKNPGSFEAKNQIPPEEGYDFSYHNLVCPLANFARKYGYEAYMPYLCNLDYVMFGILDAPLFREHLCFEGSFCDFKLKAGAEPLPYWPPVFSQGKGCR